MFIRRLRRAAGISALLAATGASSAPAQLPTYGVGRPPTGDEVKAWDLTIPPDGQGLPPGSGTAVAGKPIFEERCASCHGLQGEDPKYILLVGGQGTQTMDRMGRPIKTIGSFWPYATTLWSYINRAQPFDEPGSLTADQVYAVTAYLLYLNGIIGEQEVMDAKTLPLVKMPNRDGFVHDSRPDVGKTSRSKHPGGRPAR